MISRSLAAPRLGQGLLLLALSSTAYATDIRLEYRGRYDHQPGGPDHLMGVEVVGEHYALISSYLALTLVDLNSLPPGGTTSYLFRLPGLACYTTVTRPDGYCFVNIRQGGLAVVRVDLSTETLTLLTRVSEPGVFYEKMAIVGDLLYVAAHAYGVRVFDITNPAEPRLIGRLDSGFADAFAIAVDGSTAYVADGAGGLKILDVSNPAQPRLLVGEDVDSAAATAEDVTVVGEYVYVASGGAGIAVYPKGGLSPRRLFDTPICAKHFARLGDRLGVADIGGVQVFTIQPDGGLVFAAGETAMRRSAGGLNLTLRLWHGIAAWGTDHLVAANWDSTDIYRLVSPGGGSQPDATASTQRLRFKPGGGTQIVQVRNDGLGTLNITDIASNASTFSATPRQAVLEPGQSIDITVAYAGGQPGSGMLAVRTNDPDEYPLVIQVFGQTSYLDPGEAAYPFSLESWTYDHETKSFTLGTFDLRAQLGKVVYFRVFGTW